MFTAQTAQTWISNMADAAHEHAHALTELDAAIGDADHGANLDRGFTACAALSPAETPGAFLKTVGMTLVSKVGGASGPLYGTFFLRMAASLGNEAEVSTSGLAEAFRAGVAGVAQRGKSTTGEKTMLDALDPAASALESAQDAPLAEALQTASEAAEAGREATRPLLATKGRASYLGERSKDHTDPGAASAALLVKALADAVS